MAALAADITAKMVPSACVTYVCTGPPVCTLQAPNTTAGNTFTAAWGSGHAKVHLDPRRLGPLLPDVTFADLHSAFTVVNHSAATLRSADGGGR